MSFERLEILLFAVVGIPVLAMATAGTIRRWRTLMRAWGPAAADGRGKPGVRVTAYALSWGLRAVAVVLGIVALARPIYGEREVEIQRRGVDLLIALDVSRSMLAADPAPSRLAWAKREAADLLKQLPGARIGLISFAGTAFLQCPFTVDRETLALFLENVSPEYLPIGGSSIGEAIAAAAEAFDPASPADKAIIMLSDGEATSPGLDDAAEKVSAAGIRVFALGIGSSDGAPVPAGGGGFMRDGEDRIVVSKLGEDALKLLARKTGGAYVRARSDGADTEALVGDLRAKLREAEFESGVRKVPEDRYQWFLGPALLCWLLGLIFGERRTGAAGARAIALAVTAAVLTGAPARAELSFREAVREGMQAFEAGDFATAASRFGEAAVGRPEDPRPVFNRGVALYEAGRYSEAAEGFEKLTVGEGENRLRETAWYNLGNARYRAGDLEGAVKGFEEALAIDPEDEDARQNLEFVKKRLEEMQQQQQQSGQEQNKEGDPEDEGDQQKAGDQNSKEKGQEQKSSEPSAGQQARSSDADENRQSSGEQERQESAGEEERQQTADSGEEQEQPQEGEQSARRQEIGQGGEERSEAASRIFGGEAGQRRAEALLERLQDRPGTALLPQYRQRTVEKDW